MAPEKSLVKLLEKSPDGGLFALQVVVVVVESSAILSRGKVLESSSTVKDSEFRTLIPAFEFNCLELFSCWTLRTGGGLSFQRS